ncbi:hypothetical protein F7734_49580 [Scytonema sp. UIC 10036]|uniref:hypothetical protein n=1 Tax=Scytonema sp. UIC 10036 TaxID=2304196 RepID=UPI0012DA2D25|nr:hypothetical protein [Scytonema sp. UIC 10036]MUG99904.1 hypothetical protein [Scytonema sp. UIC 10036]
MKTRKLEVKVTNQFGIQHWKSQKLAFCILTSTLSRGAMPCARTSLGIWSAFVALAFPCFAGEAKFSSAEAAENWAWGIGHGELGIEHGEPTQYSQLPTPQSPDPNPNPNFPIPNPQIPIPNPQIPVPNPNPNSLRGHW